MLFAVASSDAMNDFNGVPGTWIQVDNIQLKSATGTLNEITFNPRLFTKSIDPNQNEVNMLKTLETLPCTLVIQDTDNDNKNASIRVKLDNNPRLSFVTAVKTVLQQSKSPKSWTFFIIMLSKQNLSIFINFSVCSLGITIRRNPSKVSPWHDIYTKNVVG